MKLIKNKFFKYLYKNSLIIVFLGLAILSLLGQFYNGYIEYNKSLKAYYQPQVDYGEYFISGHFIQATFENWESEFLQMLLFVLFTIFLRQKGSSESMPLKGPIINKSELKPKENSPWPVKKGGIWLAFYKHSLSIALFLLFVISFVFHFYGSLINYNKIQQLEHKPVTNAIDYGFSSRFWFESFQNWQSEFLSIFAIIYLSIYLRQIGSSQSKAVDAPNNQTGEII
jgi:hypothetical protein